MYSLMSMRVMALLVVEQERGQRARELGLADAGRAEEDERADRPARVLEPGARATNGVRHGGDRLVLADDALVQLVLHADELGLLALQQPRDGHAGPRRDDLGDVVRVDLFLEQPPRAVVAWPAPPPARAACSWSSGSLPYLSSAACA